MKNIKYLELRDVVIDEVKQNGVYCFKPHDTKGLSDEQVKETLVVIGTKLRAMLPNSYTVIVMESKQLEVYREQ